MSGSGQADWLRAEIARLEGTVKALRPHSRQSGEMSASGVFVSTKEDTILHYEAIIADLKQALADLEPASDDTGTLEDNRKRYFQTGVERIREMRENMEGLAAQAAKLGLPDAAFNDWRNAFDRQEKGFRDQVDRPDKK